MHALLAFLTQQHAGLLKSFSENCLLRGTDSHSLTPPERKEGRRGDHPLGGVLGPAVDISWWSLEMWCFKDVVLMIQGADGNENVITVIFSLAVQAPQGTQ